MGRAVLLVLVAIIAAACGGAPPSAASGSPAPVRLHVGVPGVVADAAFFIGDARGYFKEEGIELDVSTFPSAADMIAPLGRGQLDVGGGAASAGLMNAITRDVPLKIVADKGSIQPGHGYEALVVRKELWTKGTFKAPADLRGKTVALSARNITPEVTLGTFLQTGGLGIQDIRIVTMPFPDMAAAMANGSIDAAVLTEPFMTNIVEKGIGAIWKREDEIIPKRQISVVLYSPRLQEKPDLARRFMVAYLKGARYYNDAFVKGDAVKKREVTQILMRNTAVKEQAVYDRMIMPLIEPNGRVNVDSLALDQEWYLRSGVQKIRADLSKVVDQQFADWAVRRLGAYK